MFLLIPCKHQRLYRRPCSQLSSPLSLIWPLNTLLCCDDKNIIQENGGSFFIITVALSVSAARKGECAFCVWRSSIMAGLKTEGFWCCFHLFIYEHRKREILRSGDLPSEGKYRLYPAHCESFLVRVISWFSVKCSNSGLWPSGQGWAASVHFIPGSSPAAALAVSPYFLSVSSVKQQTKEKHKAMQNVLTKSWCVSS